MGAHANQGIETIFSRKMQDIGKTGTTFWLMRSTKACPPSVAIDDFAAILYREGKVACAVNWHHGASAYGVSLDDGVIKEVPYFTERIG